MFTAAHFCCHPAQSVDWIYVSGTAQLRLNHLDQMAVVTPLETAGLLALVTDAQLKVRELQ